MVFLTVQRLICLLTSCHTPADQGPLQPGFGQLQLYLAGVFAVILASVALMMLL